VSQDHDISHDGLEERDRVLIAAYRGESEDLPSQAVDDAIRAAARKAVGARPQAPGRFRFGAWNVPLAVAATVVLSATVAFMAVREHGLSELGEVTPPRVVESAPAALESAPAAVAVPAPAESAASAQSAPAETRPAKAAETQRADAGAAGRDFGIVTAVPAGSPAGTTGFESAEVEQPVVARAREEASAPIAPEARSKRSIPVAGANAVSERSPTALADGQPPAEGRARAASAESSRGEPAPAGAPQSTPVLPGPALEDVAKAGEGDAPGERDGAPRTVESAAARTQAPVSAATLLRREAAQFKAAAPKTASPKAADGVAALPPPDERVARIRALLRDGRRAEALAVLSALRRDYPDYLLPADMSVLVKELPAASR